MRLFSKHIIFNLLMLVCMTVHGENSLKTTQVESKLVSFVAIEQGYIRETIPGTTISSAYMTIRNDSHENIVLIGVSSKVSERIELHTHQISNGMMRMRKLDRIIIPANEQVVLQPSGLHIMIFDLDKRLQAESEIQLSLQFSNSISQNVTLPVRSIKESHQH